MSDPKPWIVCQIGAREHYVLARELNRRGRLRALVTDAWTPPGGIFSLVPGAAGKRLTERFDSALADANVVDFTSSLLAFEFADRVGRRAPDSDWDRVIARNRWFEARAARALRTRGLLEGRPTVFAYSYAARDVFRLARTAGCETVLGQIDPATSEEDIVAEQVAKHPELKPRWRRAPPTYWRHWREECELADRIVVNSEWAREGLERAGIAPAKLRMVPLAYAPASLPELHRIPERFDAARPLRVLFLGTFNLRKGAAELLEAARQLRDAPVEFHVVGPTDLSIPQADRANSRLILHGAVPREQAHVHFAAADVFVLPTRSDGFGLTQLEAQAHGLTVIASRCCGEVVRHGVDGIVLDEVSGAAIAAAIGSLLSAPQELARMCSAARENVGRFSPERVVDALTASATGDDEFAGASEPQQPAKHQRR